MVMSVFVHAAWKDCKGRTHMHECACNLREDMVISSESCCSCNVDGLLSNCGQIKGNSSLPLCFIKKSVHCLKCNHVSVHFYSKFLADLITVVSHRSLGSFVIIYGYGKKKSIFCEIGERNTSTKLLPKIS